MTELWDIHVVKLHHNELVLTYRKWTLYILMGGKTDWTVMIIPSGIGI